MTTTPTTVSGPSPATAYDPFDPAFLRDPYAGYRLLRAQDPVHHHPADHATGRPEFWALARFDDVYSAVRDTESFSSAHGLTFYEDEIGKLGLAPTIVMMDPPEHSSKRRLIGKAFSPRRVALTEDVVRGFVAERLDELGARAADGETVDLHRDFATTVPTFVLSHLLGLPEADRPRLDPWVEALTTIQDDGFAMDGLNRTGAAAVAEMFGYFAELVADRRAHLDGGGEPGDDLITALLQAQVDGETLTDWDVLGFCFVIVAGGNDTTGSLISHTVMLLAREPAQRAQVACDPALIPGALEECLRLESSVQALARFTLRDVRVGDHVIPAGQKVMMLYGSANRDEREFGPAAEELDIHREIGRHLAFSHGPHFCIGSHFAKLQARVAVEGLYARHPELGVDESAAERLASPFTRGFARLPATGLRGHRAGRRPAGR